MTKQHKRLRTLRVDDALWEAAQQAAAERDETLSNVLRDALREYVAKHALAQKG